MRTVLLRFLAANGPADAADFARWWGYLPGPARRVFRDNADALAQVEVDGAALAVRAEDADELSATPSDGPPVVRLLPGFDPYVIAPISHRRRFVPDAFTGRVSRTSGWISPVLVADGEVIGVWAYELAGEGLRIAVQQFGRVSAAVRRAAEAHAGRYVELLGATELTIVWE